MACLNNFYVYILRHPGKSEPFYVGKGSNGRIGQHRSEALALFGKCGRKCLKINIIHKLWKLGMDYEVDIVVHNLMEEESFEYEKLLIKIYGRKDNNTGILANLTDGGEGKSGTICLEETRKRMSKAQTGERHSQYGKHRSEETRRKLSEAHKGEKNHNYGRPMSEEQKRKIGEANKGKSMTEDQKRKISETTKGKLISAQTKSRMGEARKGKTHSVETKRKIGEKSKGRYLSVEGRKKMSDAHKVIWAVRKGLASYIEVDR